MISRIWHGWTTRANADAYERLLLRTIVPGITARRIPGYRGMRVDRRDAADGVEFVTTMFFESLAAVVAFAGTPYERCVVPAAAQALLARYDTEAAHYEVRALEPASGSERVA
jgi:antibiotic biosynthesis monooxygenase (ABM) superfamily enzyme